jgi:hypothetical protein
MRPRGVTPLVRHAVMSLHRERRSRMEGFEWARNNLGVLTPYELQALGVNVYFAPLIERGRRIVNLADGRVDVLLPEEHPPRTGYYADYESLARYCEKHGLPFAEINGIVTVQPVSTDEAGNPLLHGGEHDR